MDIIEHARAEAQRRHAETERSLNAAIHASGSDYHENDGYREGFVEGAEWAIANLKAERQRAVFDVMDMEDELEAQEANHE